LEARNNYVDAQATLGDAGDEYLTLMHATQAISGMRDPVNPKSVEQGVKGVLQSAIGMGDSPKGAAFQYKVIGSAVDQVGRGTITADKNLDMDQVSIPKAMAWEIFKPYVIRRLVRSGLPAATALREVKEQTPMAMGMLQEEMKNRPVVYNRAPALHRYAYTGAFARLRDDDAIGLPYAVLKGIGGDYDGDNINVHVPSSSAAVNEVLEKMLPSKSLRHPGTFETHFEPVQDYLHGLYLATRPDPKQTPRTFPSAAAAKAAYARGEITARTPIRIV
jgi:DNA-directed RNA polymerase beta' subunit